MKMNLGESASDPAVSVIVTVYDRSRFLMGALESVHAQGFRDFEIIVADDAASPARHRAPAQGRVTCRMNH